jgi:hypothetical protein
MTTKWLLSKTLFGNDPMPQHFVASDGAHYFGILQSIEREDGSGQSFNVRIANQSGNTTFHVKTED